MWYLLVWITGAYAPSLTVIPEKYPTEEACHAAAKSDRWSHSCIPAPVSSSLATNLPQYDKDGNLKVSPYPGYYCGNNPDNCKLNINCKGIIESYDNGKIFICR